MIILVFMGCLSLLAGLALLQLGVGVWSDAPSHQAYNVRSPRVFRGIVSVVLVAGLGLFALGAADLMRIAFALA